MKFKLPAAFNRRDITLIIIVLAGAGIIALINYAMHRTGNLQNNVVTIFINNEMIGNISFSDAISTDKRNVPAPLSGYYTVGKDGITPIDKSDVENKSGPVIETRAGKVRVCKNDCPNQTCMKQGWISRPGECIICVPHHLLVSIQPVMSNTEDDTPAEYASLTY